MGMVFLVSKAESRDDTVFSAVRKPPQRAGYQTRCLKFCYRWGFPMLWRASMGGIPFSYAEVTTINRQGFWLQYRDEELYLPFVEFPAFEHATVAQICKVECLSGSRVYWPALDIDLTLDQIRNPMVSSCHRDSFDC
jgi:hypothetical protein